MKRKIFFIGVAVGILCGVVSAADTNRLNVLFIAVDDLRPELNSFGAKGIVAPNIEKLVKRGTVFQHAYCQYAVCGPSRASLMSGLRPTHSRFIINRKQPSVDEDVPGCLTLAKHFKENGYFTQSLAKIYHNPNDASDGWSVPRWYPNMRHNTYNLPENQKILEENKGYGPAFECADVPDEAYPGGVIAQEAVQRIQEAAEKHQPFFFAVGFWRPHLPFNAPKKYWDLYPEEDIQLSPNPNRPEDVPDIAMHDSPELRCYTNIPKVGKIDDSLARKLIRGYRACVSYSDTNVGKVLDALEATGQMDRTIIVLWGDHGWHLGDNSMWGKESTFERALRTTLLVVDPRRKGGQSTDALVEMVDIYPTLCELCGLDLPEHLEGSSFVPVLDNPDSSGKEAVFSCFVRLDQRNKEGWSVRNDRYRYTEWKDRDGVWKGCTLFDLTKDPGENVNLADQSKYKSVQKSMKDLLSQGWRPFNGK